MKLLYVNIIANPLIGIIEKLKSQAKALNEINPECKTLLICCETPSVSPEDGSLQIEKMHPERFQGGLSSIPRLAWEIINKHSPDVVILRSYGGAPFYWYYFKSRKFALITEHHTKLVPELIASGRWKMAILEFFFQKLFGGYPDGKIGVTNEILEYEMCRKPMYCIPNGINAHKFKEVNFLPFNGRTLDLAMFCSVNQPWHGLDRLFRSVKKWEETSNVNFTVHVAGRIDAAEFPETIMPRKVIFHGLLSSSQLRQLLDSVNLAVSSLALFRNKMKEACVLKSREYIAYRMPFIYGYTDPDLTGSEPFAIKVPNDDSLLNLNLVLQFCERMTRDREYINEEMEKYTTGVISWASKMFQYNECAKEILANKCVVY